MHATVMRSNSREQLDVGKQLGFFLRTGILKVKGMVSRPNVLSSPLQECLVQQLASWMTCGTLFKSIFSLVSHKQNREKAEKGIHLVITEHDVSIGSCDFYIIEVNTRHISIVVVTSSAKHVDLYSYAFAAIRN